MEQSSIQENLLPDPEQREAKDDKKSIGARVFILLFLITIIICLFCYSKEVSQFLQDFVLWIKNHPVAGPFALAFVYILCAVLFVPGSILTLGAGFAFK